MIGATLAGRYRILDELGRGGMGVVYRAQDVRTGATVAVKTLPPELAQVPDLLARFQREAQALAALHHPNIVRLIETFEDGGAHYLVMEYIDGTPLSRVMQEGPLPPEQARAIILQVCAALEYAHARGIVHRDIKSTNIMLARDGTIKVMDFGIARMLDATVYTVTGQSFGTPETMSPEQVRGERVDARSDVYSLGVVLYRMLTGQQPFPGDSPYVIGYKHLHEEPILPRQVNPAVPEGLEAIALYALGKGREERYQRVADLAADLRLGELSTPEAQAQVETRKLRIQALGDRRDLVTPPPAFAPPKPMVAPKPTGRRGLAIAVAIGGGGLVVALVVCLLLAVLSSVTSPGLGPVAEGPSPTSRSTSTGVSVGKGTSTPIATATPLPSPTATPTRTPTSTPAYTPTPTPCQYIPTGVFGTIWSKTSVKARLGCALNSPHETWGAYQLYQNAAMLWRQDAGKTYVIYGAAGRSGHWREYKTSTQQFSSIWQNLGDTGRATSGVVGQSFQVEDFAGGDIVYIVQDRYVFYKDTMRWEKL